jgi:hypothetical protein
VAVGILACSVDGLNVREAYYVRILSFALGGIVAAALVLRITRIAIRRFGSIEVRSLHSFAGLMVFQNLVEQPLLDLIIMDRYGTSDCIRSRRASEQVVAVGATARNLVMALVFAKAIAASGLVNLRLGYSRMSRWMAASAVVAALVVLTLQPQILQLFGTNT